MLGNIAEAMDALEAEAEAIMEMVGRRSNNLPVTSSQRAESAAESSNAAASAPGQSSGETTDGSANTPSETPMDVDQPGMECLIYTLSYLHPS